MTTQTTNLIWCYRGFGHWEQYPAGHPQAIRHQQAMDGMIPKWRERRERELKSWLDKRQRMLAERAQLDYLMATFKEPVVDLYKSLLVEHHDYILEAIGRDECITTQMVALDKIIPTQEDINLELVRWYLRSGYSRDEKNRLPLGLRFYGDDEIYLIDGHHRYAAEVDRANGAHRMMYLDVDDIEMTFEEACGTLEPFPVDVVALFDLLVA